MFKIRTKLYLNKIKYNRGDCENVRIGNGIRKCPTAVTE